MDGSLTLAGGRPVVADNPFLRVAPLTLGGAALVASAAVSASLAGFGEQVSLPDWWGPWPTGGRTSPVWLAVELLLVGAMCVLWLALALRWLTPPGPGAPAVPPVRALAAMAVGWALPLLPSGPMASLDVASYAAVGRLSVLGVDPYQFGPGVLADDFSAAVSPLWMWTPTPYGPVQVGALRVVAEVAGDHVGTAILLIRVLAVLGLVAAVALALRSAAPEGRGAVMLLTALNPLVLVTIVSGAHLDVLIGALAVLVVLLVRSDRHWLAMAVAVIAVMIKLPGLVLVGYVLFDLLRRTPAGTRLRTWLQVAGAGLVALGAVVLLAPDPFGWVAALGVPGTTRNGMAPSTWVSSAIALVSGQTSGHGLDEAFTVGRTLTAIAGAAGAAVLLWRSARPDRPDRVAYRGVGWALVVVALSGPSTYPWYLTWGLFAAAVGSGTRGRLWLLGLSVALCAVGSFSGGLASIVVLLGLIAAVAVVVLRHRASGAQVVT